MRALALLAATLVVAGALTGCIGNNDPIDTAGDDGATTAPPLPGTGGKTPGGVVKVLSPLTSTVTASGPQWVKSGTSVAVAAAAPAQAKGTVNYTWALGALPGTVAVTAATLDTKVIESGKSASLKFAAAGVYRMHCHPHPYMKHNVTVIEGYKGPATVEVSIIDGASVGEYRFVPENIVVGAGTTVVYTNRGAQPHTATLESQEPALKALDLKAASGEVAVTGNGWQRIVVLMQDSEGRVGASETRIYVTSELPAFPAQSIPLDFTVGGVPEAAPALKVPVKFDHNGTVTINVSVQDAAAANGAPVNNALVSISFAEDGATQDTLSSDPTAKTSLTGLVAGKTYILTITPTQGVGIEGTAEITAVYDLVPPAPSMAPASGGHDDHGAHAGH